MEGHRKLKYENCFNSVSLCEILLKIVHERAWNDLMCYSFFIKMNLKIWWMYCACWKVFWTLLTQNVIWTLKLFESFNRKLHVFKKNTKYISYNTNILNKKRLNHRPTIIVYWKSLTVQIYHLWLIGVIEVTMYPSNKKCSPFW